MDRTFGELLRDHRLAHGLTQHGLAEKAQLSEQAVGALERGDRRYPQAVTVERLAGVFGLAGADRELFVRLASRKGTPRRPVAGTPRQLPAGIAHFTGRSAQVALVADLLRDRSAAAVVSISGMGGVGKTSLAVHVGHLLVDDFPDGQLYLDLQGHGERSPVAPLEALGLFLRSLGVAGKNVPATVSEAALRLRTELAGRRVLLLLDNAADSEQVTPLLPGTVGAAAIVTSRRALLTCQARQVQLDVLTEPDAVALLATTAPDQVAAEPGAAAEVVRRCGRLPLAVRLAGARLAARPSWRVSHLAERLAGGRRLEELDQGEAGVRACFALSIDGLAGSDEPVDRVAAEAYPLLAWPDLPDLSVPVAARLLDRAEHDTERLLERLTAACLLEAPSPGRYRLHDLLRVYGAGLAEASAREALTRVVRLYAGVAWRGLVLSSHGSPRFALAPDLAGTPEFADAAAAYAWLERERAHVVAAAAQADPDDPVLATLAVGLFEFYRTRGLWRDWRQVCQAALRAPVDRLTHAYLLSDLAGADAELAHRGDGDFEQVRQHIRAAIALFEQHGDDDCTARALNNACYAFRLGGAVREAIELGERSRALGSRDWTLGLKLVNLAELYGQTGDRATQHRYLAEAIAVLEPLDAAHGMAYALVVLGLAQRAEDRFPEAIANLRRSAELWRRIDDTPGEANTLADLGETLLAAGERDAARDVLADAQALLRRIGDPARERKVAELLAQIGPAGAEDSG
ncbi:tetratricopeptide repeat protein [Nocardia sp. NRRL S-836]|uniref:ATP-binding protein n=1 Tax=Nocardia sp. NRRL S-836 TaxID=1519492 RepID=UPI0006AFA626|nr:helix-turn-helix domain-containing protein [Nocardia sp. NRRL S-836]